MKAGSVHVPNEQLAELCQKRSIKELSLFGSVLQNDFRPDSDIDILVSFKEGINIGLWELAALEEDLESIFCRKVDLVERDALLNPYRRDEIMGTREVLHAA